MYRTFGNLHILPLLSTLAGETENTHKSFVGLFVNESPVELKLCRGEARGVRPGLCPLEVLEKEASLKTSGWKSMKQLCTLPDSG